MSDTPTTADSESDAPPAVVTPSEEVSADQPLVVIPRGGAAEVGRSCYQVETTEATYLVDCGLNQGGGGQFPDLRGLDEYAVDVVFLTHAHIDHIGGLPVLEHRNLLAPDAKIVTTAATAAIADVLLHDSLRIHMQEVKNPGHRRRFTRVDVENVLQRFEPVSGYRSGRATDGLQHVDDDLTYQFGNAGHLLGSAWLALEAAGRRVVFSGDLGGRSGHLPEIEQPPAADTLFLESTYGDRDTHPSFSNARTQLYETAIDAVEQGVPVLIPTFAVGRAQEVLQIFRERWRNLPEEIRDCLDIVYDGMATEATDRYHAYTTPQYVKDSVINYVENAGNLEPYLPDCAWRPTGSGDRADILDGESAPIIVVPSGMLTGGLSPAYLAEMTQLYDEARIIFTGYQAEGTPGRALQEAEGPTASIEVSVWPLSTDELSDDQAEDEMWEADTAPIQQLDIPTRWVRTIGGMSGHAARNALLQFARHVDPDHIALVHGDAGRQRQMIEHFTGNIGADEITQASIQTPVPVYSGETELVAVDVGGADASLTVQPEAKVDPELAEDPVATMQSGVDGSEEREQRLQELLRDDEMIVTEEWVEHVTGRLEALEAEVAAARHAGRSEAELRELIRDEIGTGNGREDR